MAPSGNLALWEADVGNAQLGVVRTLDIASLGAHASLGKYANGHDTYNAVAHDEGPNGSGVGSLVTHDMTTGVAQVVVGPDTGYPYPPSATHVSALAFQQPGWAFVSVIGDPAGQGILDNELLVADTNTGEVCRVGHHRSFGKNNTHLATPYWAEPHAVPSPSGTRLLFASDWGNGTSVDSYVVELPGYSGATSGADLRVTLTDSPDPVVIGTSLTYTIVVTNGGPQPATGVTLRQTLPASFTFLSATTGCTAASLTVTCPLGNLAASASTTVTVTASPTAAGSFSSQATVSATQADPVSANNTVSQATTVHPIVSVNDASVTEGNSGTKPLSFTVSLSAPSNQQITVPYSTVNNTATAGSDYTAASGTLTIAPGATTGTVNVTVISDTVFEGDESFWLNLGTPVNATLGDGQGIGTILNDDTAGSVSLSINDVAVTEGNTGTTNATFAVTLSASSSQTVTVTYTTANGTATAGSDYAAKSGTLTFAPGVTTQPIAVLVMGDATVEPNETFVVNLSGPVNATIGDSQGVGTITNDDSTPPPPPPGTPVVWKTAVGVTVSANSLTKTASTAWGNAGAVSTQTLASGDGYVEITASETTTYRMVGLSNGDSGQSYADIDFAVYETLSGVLQVFEKGTGRGNFGTYTAGDKLQVAVESGVVKYKKNGTTFYTSAQAPTYPLLVDSALYTVGATLNSATLTGGWSTASPPPPPPPPPPGTPVVWTTAAGVSVSGSSLTKTAAAAWGNAGAVSTQTLASGDGYVEITASETTTYRMVGLSNGDSGQSYSDIDFAVYESLSGVLQVFEKGTGRGNFGAYTAGDKLQVAVESGVVKYKKNGTTFYTSTQAPTYPLLVDSALYTMGATLNSATLTGGWSTASPPPPPPPGTPVVWKTAVGVTVSTNSLTKTASTAWGNAGAVSTQTLASGDGYVEITASETTTYRMVGLSNGDSGQNYTDIDFAVYESLSGVLQVFEKGTGRGNFGTYAAGDKLQVAVESGVVKYKKNGVTFYTSTQVPTYPLLVDSAFYTMGATLNSATLTGGWH